ncbi:protein kinase [Microbispora sp. NPDC049125]|uniref:serine/threonine-protein kinase n=1 Tax=Microbispora sp. NPDC049125 TaxID=3154929 RepID=UPI003466BE5C
MNAWSVPGYREVRELGAGGAGRVVLATYSTTGAYVAIKYLREELRRDPRFLAGFRREARVMVELNDPNVVRLYEYVEARDGAAIVMELVDGVPLRRILTEHGSTSPEAALVVLKGSLAGLSSAHASGIVHRDYKPENVLIQADGASKLSDFGIATPSGSPDTPAGTPPYMAPEQWTGSPAGPATDVYAATCVFFECLTGHRPYRADHPAGLRHQHQSAPIPALEVPGSVRGLVLRGLAKNPADRPPTARAFIADLEAAAVAAHGPDWEQRGRRHLAELATLLALTFPLATPAEPVEVSTSLARTVLADRMAHFAPRFALGGVVLSAVVVAALIAANRQTPVAQNTLLTPPPHSQSAAPTAGTPSGTDPGDSAEPSTVRPPDEATTDPTDEPVTDPTSEPTDGHGGGTGAGPTSPTTGATSGTVTTPPPHTPPHTPPPSPPPPSPRPLAVTALGITRFDGRAAEFRVAASTTARVLLTARFSDGPSPGSLTARPPETIALEGARTYNTGLQYGFATPACGTTVYREVRIETVPAAAGGARGKLVKVAGPPCPPPAVESLAISRWDGASAAVAVGAGGTGPVKVSTRFTRDGEAAGDDTRTLTGKRSYAFTVKSGIGPVACGEVAVLGVRVSTDPAAPGGPQTREIRVPGPRCPPPTVSIGSWNGTTVTVGVKTGSTAPVSLSVAFTQRLTYAEQTLTFEDSGKDTLSGAKDYTRSFGAEFRQPKCGFTDVRTVTVTASPGGASASDTVTVQGPPCPEPDDDPSTSPPPGDTKVR